MSGKLLKRAPLLILAAILLLTGCPRNTSYVSTLTLIEGARGVIPFDSASFVWSGDNAKDGLLKYEYRKDGGDWVDHGTNSECTWTGYEDGLHRFEVRAQDSNELFSEELLCFFFYDEQGSVFPCEPVTIICPYRAGGGTDRLSRFVANELSVRLDEIVFVENETGGGGVNGHVSGANANPNGYTMTMVTSDICTIHWMDIASINYQDFDYIVQLNEDIAGVIVAADAPWDSVQDLLDCIEGEPGEVVFSGSSAGSIWDLARIGMLSAAGLDIDSVIWSSTMDSSSIARLLEGEVDVLTSSITEASLQIKSGNLKLLAVMSDQRLTGFLNIPTLKEEGIDWETGTWRGLAVPNNTPEEIKAILEAEILRMAHSEEFLDISRSNGFEVRIRDSKEFEEFVEEQDTLLGAALKLGGFIN